YIDHGDPIFHCESRDALLWHAKSIIGNSHSTSGSFLLCCCRGKVKLGNEMHNPPKLLMDLINENHPKSKNFIENIRRYNLMFSLTSIRAKQDTSVNQGHGVYCYRIQGQNYHRMGTLLPEEGKPPTFAQLYIYDTDNEIQNKIQCVSNEETATTTNNAIDHALTIELRDMLDIINPLVAQFCMAGERLVTTNDENKFKLKLIGTRVRDGREYILPTALEVAYPLLHPYGEHGYWTDIYHEGIIDETPTNKKTRVTMREYFAYRLQNRPKDFSMVLNARRLCQQFIVDAYTMIERERMSYIRNQQTDLRSETYSKLAKLSEEEDLTFKLRGKKVILPSSYTGSPRYMMQNYLDEMIICKGLKLEDRLDIITRVFKQKLDSLMKDFKDNHYFGRLQAAWRIYGFDIHYRFPPVERLPFHLEGEQSIIFDATESIDYALDKASVNETKFIAWMEVNKKDPDARKLLYHEFPTYYVWRQEERVWLKRQKGTCIGRVHHVPPSSGELFYLRVLLNKVRGAKDWIDFKKYDNVVYPTYKDACQARGLLEDDKEYIDGILEASLWGSVLAADVLQVEHAKHKNPDLELTDIQRKNICLTYIEHMLLCNNKSLNQIPNMPYPNEMFTMASYNRLVHDELKYKKEKLKQEHKRLYTTLINEQKGIYQTLIDAVNGDKGGMFFVYGYGGTGKTYLYKTLYAALRSKSEIVLNVASSGIAALLLDGG
ncbi:ATP-dependent DNA helicase PIF1, partial [Tanacetum coccineum]